MKKELIKLANHLDNIGHGDLADKLDVILKSAADSSKRAEIGDDYDAEAPPDDDDTGTPDDDGMGTTDEILARQHTANEEPPPLVNEYGEEIVSVGASSAQDRINKMAELMGREFNTYVPGTFSR